MKALGDCWHCEREVFGPCSRNPMTCMDCFLFAVEFLEWITGQRAKPSRLEIHKEQSARGKVLVPVEA